MPVPDTDPIVNIPMVTPFDEQDRVDLDAVSFNVEKWLQTPARGFLVGSVSGEEAYLSDDEKLSIVKTAGQTLNGRGCLMGGIDCPSSVETLRRAEAFAEAGADMVRIRFPRSEDLVIPYFEQVLPRCPLPVLLMHQCMPERFGLAGEPAARPEIIGQVCSMDGVFGYVTDHDLRFEARVRMHVPESCRFWICNGSLIVQGTLIGCIGTTTAFANIWPAALHEMLKLGMEGRYEEAWPQQQLIQKIDAIMLPYKAAGIKATMNLLGYKGTHPRAPTKPMPAEDVLRVESLLREGALIE